MVEFLIKPRAQVVQVAELVHVRQLLMTCEQVGQEPLLRTEPNRQFVQFMAEEQVLHPGMS